MSVAPLVLELAGSTVAIEGLPDFVASTLRAHWAPFVRTGLAQGRLTIAPDAVPAGELPRELPRALRHEDTIQIVGEGFSASGDLALSEVRLERRCDVEAVSGVLKLMVARRIHALGGLLVHGVSLALEGNAALFWGPSGAGKSTLATLGETGGLTLLADELVAVFPTKTGWSARGTPWNRGQDRGACLDRIGVLAHGPRAQWQAIAPEELLSTLVANSVLWLDDEAQRRAIFRAAASLTTSVASARLSFAIAPDVSLLLREALSPT